MSAFKELQALFSQFGNSKFLPHLLEPLLLWGIVLGTASWMLSLWLLRDRKARICSLVLLALSAFAILPAQHYRKKAAPLTAPSQRQLNEQNDRRHDTRWVYLAFGSLAVLGIFLTGPGKGRGGTVLTIAITLGGIAVSLFSLWLHEKEIVLFHPDARRVSRSVPAGAPSDPA